MGGNEPLLVIGLDCAAPTFIFGKNRFDLPHLSRLMDRGVYGTLRSCDPPITVPAWSCMFSGKDPGQLGCYGFRNRKGYGYDSHAISTSLSITEPRVWDVLSAAGKKVCVLGVPQTYPPSPVNGCMVSGLLTPGLDMEWTYPPELKTELLDGVGDYIFDIAGFRSLKKEALCTELFGWLANRFDTAEYLLKNKPWDFFVMVEMGLDRLHHAFWKYCDPDHPAYEAGNPYADVFERYYTEMDRRIGRLLDLIDDECGVMVVSDHGAKPMLGGVAINTWLMEQGYLKLREPLDGPIPFDADRIDWSKTCAWGEGGYYGRIYFNVAGREPWGIVKQEDMAGLKLEMIAALSEMTTPAGRLMDNRCIDPKKHYKKSLGNPPELMVYWDELNFRSIGVLGAASVFVSQNDTGVDEANHDFNGIYVSSGVRCEHGQGSTSKSLFDVTPTILDWFNLPVPSDMMGASWLTNGGAQM